MVNDMLKIEDAQLGRGAYRNFAGEKTQYNAAGKRSFVVILDEEQGRELEHQGWHIRWREPRDEMDDRKALLTVEVRFGAYPPKVALISNGTQTILTEDNIAILDTAELARVDLKIRPYNWTVRDETGTKAYLHTGYFTLAEDDFGGRYR